MSEHDFKPGDEVFLEDGSTASYVAAAGGDHVIQSIYGGEDEEPWLGSPRTVRLVFKAAPIARFEQQIVELSGRASELATQIADRRSALQDIERKIAAQNDNLRRHRILETLDDLLAGRITHILTISWSRDEVRVRPIAEAAKDERSYSSLTALTLSASIAEPGKVIWSFARDYQGFQGFRLFRSRDEAIAAASEHIAARTKMWAGGRSDVNPAELAKSCMALGIEVDAKMAEAVAARERELAEKRVAEATRNLDLAVAQLRDLQTTQVPA